MSVSLRLDIKQTQGLVLTPQLQQAIKLLQYSNQELIDAVQKEADGNPFIQVVDPGFTAERTKPATTGNEPAAPNGTASDKSLSVRKLAGGSQDDRLPSAIDRLTEKPNLTTHLHAQLLASRGDKRSTQLARLLAAQVDADGYLRNSDNELAALFDAYEHEIAAARQILQSCEPTGVGAQDLAECLSLQLRELDRLDPAMMKLVARLPQMARAEWNALERACGVDREDLEEMVREIKALDPRPGSRFAGADIDAVIPDMFISRKPDGGWRIELNGRALPRVLVDESYVAEIGGCGGDKAAKEFVSEKLQAAGWLQKALEQRARTMIRVASAIFQRQRGFLDRGPQALRPLVLRDIAEATSLHESTISRATSEKYVQTPRGTFPLKYFFTTAIHSSGTDGDHSAEAIRMKIRDMVGAEKADAVLSDDQIVNDLKAQGVIIARRTVAKYRESLKIPSSVQRRRAKSLMNS